MTSDETGWITDAGRRAIHQARNMQRADRYVIADHHGWTYLWCQDHTAGSDDYLEAWEGSALQHAEAIAAVRKQHETEKHQLANPGSETIET